MKMKNAVIISLLIVISIFTVGNILFTQEIESEDLFMKVRNAYMAKFPTDFTADIQSTTLSKELAGVPDYEKLNPEEPFNIKFIFLKDYGERIIVENACMLTRNKFQDYLEVYQSFRSFLDPSITAESFFRKYIWEIVDVNNKFYVIKMSVRGSKDEYYQIYINRNDMLVERTFYFKDEVETGRVDIDYKKIGRFVVPSNIRGISNIVNEQNQLERKEFEIRLNNFKVNQNLTVDDILGDEGIDC
jgi:hypothetical protein